MADRVRLGLFKGWLSIWIALAMASGLLLGIAFPDLFLRIGALSVAEVNPVTAALVWLLILPTMVSVDYSRLSSIWRASAWRRGSAVTLVVNWVIKPFSMALLAILFFHYLFAPWIDRADADLYIAGLILLGVAPCTGMVFVWSRMTGGDADFTLAQVAVNDLVLLAAFVPLAGFLLGISGIAVPWITLGLSVAAFVVAPLVGGVLIRRYLQMRGETALVRFGEASGPLTKAGLLLLIVLLFGFQAEAVIAAPFTIGLIAVPLLVQTALIFVLAFGAAWLLRLPFAVAAPAALIGTSNFFELAVAVAIAMFGADSPAVIATVVGVLVEVPAMLCLVALANRLAPTFAAQLPARAA